MGVSEEDLHTYSLTALRRLYEAMGDGRPLTDLLILEVREDVLRALRDVNHGRRLTDTGCEEEVVDLFAPETGGEG